MSTEARGAPVGSLSRSGAAGPPAAQPAIALVIAALVGAVLVAAVGQNPIEVYAILIEGSLIGWPNLR